MVKHSHRFGGLIDKVPVCNLSIINIWYRLVQAVPGLSNSFYLDFSDQPLLQEGGRIPGGRGLQEEADNQKHGQDQSTLENMIKDAGYKLIYNPKKYQKEVTSLKTTITSQVSSGKMSNMNHRRFTGGKESQRLSQ